MGNYPCECMMLSIVGGVPIMSCLSLFTLVLYLCQFFHPPPDYYDPPGYLSSDFFPTPPRLLPPPFYFGLQSSLICYVKQIVFDKVCILYFVLTMLSLIFGGPWPPAPLWIRHCLVPLSTLQNTLSSMVMR